MVKKTQYEKGGMRMKRKIQCFLILLFLILILTGCQCSHEWESTCGNPRTCTQCGETEGEPIGHKWQEATCLTPEICELCGEKQGNALDHDWQDATCQQAQTCLRCGEMGDGALSHDYQRVHGHMRCIRCDEVDPAAPVYPPLYCEDLTEEEREVFVNLEDQNNVRNNARFLYHEGLYYGQYWDNQGNSIFLRSEPGTSRAQLLDYGWAKNIYVVDGNIYYQNINSQTGECGTFRILMEGGEYVRTEKLSGAYGSMQLKDDWLYYSDHVQLEDGSAPRAKLYRCNLDGSGETLILDKPVYEFYVFDTGILYVDEQDGGTLHMCYCDGSGDISVNNQKSSSPIFDGSFVYYLSPVNEKGEETADYTCWKIRPDGTENQQISRYRIQNAFLLWEDGIYFCNAASISQPFKMNKDGKNASQLLPVGNIYLLQILDGKLKYTKYNYNMQYIEGNYLCDLNGKNIQLFDPFA